MVGHHLHHAFRSWFKETEKDGTPLLPLPLSKKYTVFPHILGQGSFAVVKTVIEKATGQQRALKIIAKKPLKDNSEKMLKEEITILGKVEHPNIIKMWDIYETNEGVFIVTDLCRGGELFDRLVEKVHYNELDARHIMRQVIQAVDYLHSHDIIHRDLKPENILLREKSEPSEIVISDFGLSRFIPEEGLLMTGCGSPQYVSPEVLIGKGYGPAVDIWSSGVVAYALLAGYTPFYGDDQPSLFQQIIKMNVEFDPQYWQGVSDTAKHFILQCLCPAEKRMTAKQALAHPWLANLPPLHEQSARGACLKSNARRNLSSMRKLRKAVTAVEAINHLHRLHNLRLELGQALPERQQSLLSIVTNLQSNQTTELSLTSRHVQDSHPVESLETLKTPTSDQQNQQTNLDPNKPTRDKVHDSAMALDLVVMTALVSNDWHKVSDDVQSNPSGGTAAVAEAAQATMDGQATVGMVDRTRNQERNAASLKANPPDPPTAPGHSHDADATAFSSFSSSSSSSGRPSGRNSLSHPMRASRSASRKHSDSNKALDKLLDQYKTTELPASARHDPAAKIRPPPKITFANAYKFVPVLINSGIAIGSALASHAIYGPPKKSWGVEMSVFTRILRELGQYSEFASIERLQQFFDFGAFLPTPKDGLITPVTFRVKRRGLRGFLAEADAAEDGKREISGEWVVGKQTWRRLQNEWRNGKQKGKERVILYVHGGAYFVMSAATHRPLTISLSKYTECRVFGINYRLAPDTRFPGALHDVVASYFRLTDDLGIPASNIVLGADSAGGGLAMALLLYLRDNHYPLPSGAMLFSPWVDLTMSCDSWQTNSEFDFLPMPKSGDHMNPISAYLGDKVDKYLTHPYVSPLFGDLHGLPPLLIQCGDAEVLRDEVTLLAHKASLAGVAVRHELYEDCVHVFQSFLFLDASRKALQSARHFVRTALDKRSSKKKETVTEKTRQTINVEQQQGMRNVEGDKVEESVKKGKEKQQTDNDDDDDKVDAAITPSCSLSSQLDGGIEEIARLPGQVGEYDDDENEEEVGRVGNPTDEEDWELDRQPFDRKTSASAKILGKEKDNMVTSASTPTPTPTPPQRNRESTFPPITIEEARLIGQAGMHQQLSTNAPALSKFYVLDKPLTPRMRHSQSGKELAALVKSFQDSRSEGNGLETNVWTPAM